MIQKRAALLIHSVWTLCRHIEALEERVVGNCLVIAGLVIEQASIIVVTRSLVVLRLLLSGGDRVARATAAFGDVRRRVRPALERTLYVRSRIGAGCLSRRRWILRASLHVRGSGLGLLPPMRLLEVAGRLARFPRMSRARRDWRSALRWHSLCSQQVSQKPAFIWRQSSMGR